MDAVGKQAENAAHYLGKGSHVNVVGSVQNNNYDKDGVTVYTMAFTAKEIDYPLDCRFDRIDLVRKIRRIALYGE